MAVRPDPSPDRPRREIPCGGVLRGRVTPPSSKSVTHRVLNLALLSGRPAVVERPLLADDTRLFLAALDALGWSVEHGDGAVHLVPPAHPERRESGPVELFCGNAGTMFRFLTASLAAIPGRFRLDGTGRLRERPVGPLLDALRSLGARIECADASGLAPLDITGGTLRGGAATLRAGESSQYLSALLMACLVAPEAAELEVAALTSAPYVELTREAIRRVAGGRKSAEPPRSDPPADPIARDGSRWIVTPSPLDVGRFRVEGDLSAACYPAAGAALTGGVVEILGVRRDSAQGDRGLFGVLERMGASVAWEADRVTVRGGEHLRSPGAVDLSSMPDQVPTLAALAPFAEGVTRIENVAHLRIKESDRLRAMAEGLGRLGAEVEELPDGLVIPGVWARSRSGAPGAPDPDPPGPPTLPSLPSLVDPFDDHRIAMAFALVGLRRPGVVVTDPGVVAKSYPAFWDDLTALLGS